MRRFHPVVLLVVATAIIVPTACSKDNGAGATKTSFLDQANAVCRDMKAKGAVLTGPASTTKDPEALPKLIDQMNELVATSVAQLRALTPPAGDETTVTAAIDALAKAGTDAVKVSASSGSGQSAVSIAMATQTASQKASDQAMQAYGMTDCSFGP